MERLIALLPEVSEGARYGHQTWLVGGQAFAWERPFSTPRMTSRAHTSSSGASSADERSPFSAGW